MKAMRSVAWRTSRRPSLQLQQQYPLAGPQRTLPPPSRYFSTNPSPEDNDAFARLREEMLARPPTWIEDLSLHSKSKLLDLALADHLPADAKLDKGHLLPPGHHLVSFPPMLTESELLPDGTDPKHSPGPGFSRRLWAGGHIETSSARRSDPRSDQNSFLIRPELAPTRQGRVVIPDEPFNLATLYCACRESIAGVTIKGQPGREKVYVELLREYGSFAAHEVKLPIDERTFYLRITERRTLVFLRDEEVEVDVAKVQDQTTASSSGKKVRAPAPHKPDYSFELTPSRRLLFHFSALTHNAHLIHLDREYCRATEGHRDLLVHGPLSLVLMMTALDAASLKVEGSARPRKWFSSISYRNLAPLYVGETMRVCVRRVPGAAPIQPAAVKRPADLWDIWIEGPDGGMAVKASAFTFPNAPRFVKSKKHKADKKDGNNKK
ncbi:hypothetical protein PspLS_00352 [Pyricularia sp. CBS 133598]|nr:hypothetical protein PspLS_00352 [Pyricularia sp. CBS 133598]